MIELYYWKENPDTTEEKPVVHMIMELFDGSLGNHVEKHQRVSEDTAKLVIRQILDALIYLQGKVPLMCWSAAVLCFDCVSCRTLFTET